MHMNWSLLSDVVIVANMSTINVNTIHVDTEQSVENANYVWTLKWESDILVIA